MGRTAFETGQKKSLISQKKTVICQKAKIFIDL
jgi:hypothetical protein